MSSPTHTAKGFWGTFSRVARKIESDSKLYGHCKGVLPTPSRTTQVCCGHRGGF